jgi:hypothetical protein
MNSERKQNRGMKLPVVLTGASVDNVRVAFVAFGAVADVARPIL